MYAIIGGLNSGGLMSGGLMSGGLKSAHRTSTHAMASTLRFESRHITSATMQCHWNCIVWRNSDSKSMALA